MRIFNHALFGEIRTLVNEQGETFFVGKDVAEALGYNKPLNALAMHVDEYDSLKQGPTTKAPSRIAMVLLVRWPYETYGHKPWGNDS